MDWNKKDSLAVEHLSVDFRTSHGIVHAVKDVSLTVHKGYIHALVGESGSGKSVTSLSIMNLLSRNGQVKNGTIHMGDRNLLNLKSRDRSEIYGPKIGMIFQDPSAALDPLFTVENLMLEGLCNRGRMGRAQARQVAIDSLKAVNLAQTDQILKKYPFELSGGMCQRVMIAMVMAMHPEFLIADEPTTALDVTVQKQILEELYHLAKEDQIGILFITHDLGVVAEIADQVSIMQDGEIVESGSVDDVFYHPSHPYTKKLLDAVL